jgi:hypothetical protein
MVGLHVGMKHSICPTTIEDKVNVAGAAVVGQDSFPSGVINGFGFIE